MLGSLFGKKKPGAAAQPVPTLSPAVENSILSVVGARSIPPMPGAAQKAFQLSTDPNAEARNFVEVIESDEGLSARVLKIANSVYFDRGKKSTTIEESVMVIGINELRCLLNANTLSEIFPSKSPTRAMLWGHDIGTALAAKYLAQRLKPSIAELIFLGGLMHDVGKLLLLQRNPDEYAKILAVVEKEGIDFCEAEARSFPFDHTEVGQLIAQRWNFSSELVCMIREHHRAWDTIPSDSSAGIIKGADLIAHALGLGHSRTLGKLKSRAEESLPEVWSHLGIPSGDAPGVLTAIRRSFETEFDLYASSSGAEGGGH
jgi:putative nucleotidyltransferase with HDIG domain